MTDTNEDLQRAAGKSREHGFQVDWLLGALSAILATVNMRAGRRLPILARDIDFGLLLLVMLSFYGMSWWKLTKARRDRSVARWRIWTSICGCIAFSVAFAIPIVMVLTFPRINWDPFPAWLSAGLGTVLLGIVAAKGVRFSLIAGGLSMMVFLLMIPQGVL